MASTSTLKRRLRAATEGTAGNETCGDCATAKPTWASLICPPDSAPPKSPLLAILICYQCAASHRGLGTHVCRVKSLNLDEWKETEVIAMEMGGNSRVNNIYESTLVFGGDKPTPSSHNTERTSFIREKYVELSYYDKRGYSKAVRDIDSNNVKSSTSGITNPDDTKNGNSHKRRSSALAYEDLFMEGSGSSSHSTDSESKPAKPLQHFFAERSTNESTASETKSAEESTTLHDSSVLSSSKPDMNQSLSQFSELASRTSRNHQDFFADLNDIDKDDEKRQSFAQFASDHACSKSFSSRDSTEDATTDRNAPSWQPFVPDFDNQKDKDKKSDKKDKDKNKKSDKKDKDHDRSRSKKKSSSSRKNRSRSTSGSRRRRRSSKTSTTPDGDNSCSSLFDNDGDGNHQQDACATPKTPRRARRRKSGEVVTLDTILLSPDLTVSTAGGSKQRDARSTQDTTATSIDSMPLTSDEEDDDHDDDDDDSQKHDIKKDNNDDSCSMDHHDQEGNKSAPRDRRSSKRRGSTSSRRSSHSKDRSSRSSGHKDKPSRRPSTGSKSSLSRRKSSSGELSDMGRHSASRRKSCGGESSESRRLSTSRKKSSSGDLSAMTSNSNGVDAAMSPVTPRPKQRPPRFTLDGRSPSGSSRRPRTNSRTSLSSHLSQRSLDVEKTPNSNRADDDCISKANRPTLGTFFAQVEQYEQLKKDVVNDKTSRRSAVKDSLSLLLGETMDDDADFDLNIAENPPPPHPAQPRTPSSRDGRKRLPGVSPTAVTDKLEVTPSRRRSARLSSRSLQIQNSPSENSGNSKPLSRRSLGSARAGSTPKHKRERLSSSKITSVPAPDIDV